MTRITWIVLAALLIFGLWSVFVGRGANKELASYLGMWTGTLASDTQSMKGYLRIKGANKQFELHLEGPQQTVDVTGTWVLDKPTTLVLQGSDIKIDDFGGAAKRDPNKPYLENQEITSTYSKPIALNLSADKEKLTSLPLQLGGVKFTHEFKREFGKVR